MNNQKQSRSHNPIEDKYKVWLDMKTRLGRVDVYGRTDEDTALKIKEEMVKLMDKNKKIKWLINMDNVKQPPVTKARRILSKIPDHPNFNRTALFGASTTMRVAVGFILSISGKKNLINNFATEEEAIKWLNE